MSIALVTVILAPLIIGAVIAAALTYDKWMLTIGSVSQKLKLDESPSQEQRPQSAQPAEPRP